MAPHPLQSWGAGGWQRTAKGGEMPAKGPQGLLTPPTTTGKEATLVHHLNIKCGTQMGVERATAPTPRSSGSRRQPTGR